jgi:hypothetical protein
MVVAAKAEMALDQRSWELQGFISGTRRSVGSISAAFALVQSAADRTRLEAVPASACDMAQSRGI